MRLIYIFNGRLPTEKAHGLQIAKTCEAFSSLGADVELVFPFRANPIKETLFSYYGLKKTFAVKKLWSLDPMSVKGFPGRLAFFIQSATSGMSILFYLLLRRRRRNSIFYSRDYVSLFLLALLGFKPVAELHDYRAIRPRNFIRFIIGESRKIIVNSEGTLNLLKAHYGATVEKKFLVAANGVDLEFFNVKKTSEEARKLLNMPANKIIIGYVGRLEVAGEEKGVRLLLEAFKKVREDGKEFCLYVVGGPENLVEIYKNKYADGKNGNELVFTGHVFYGEIPLYLRSMDIVVIPLSAGNRHSMTTSPIKLFEFFGAGKAIIASDLPSIRNYCGQETIMFFRAGDVRDLSAKIKELAADSGRRLALEYNARRTASRYSWEARARNITLFIKN